MSLEFIPQKPSDYDPPAEWTREQAEMFLDGAYTTSEAAVHTKEFDARDISKETIEAQQLALDSINATRSSDQ